MQLRLLCSQRVRWMSELLCCDGCVSSASSVLLSSMSLNSLTFVWSDITGGCAVGTSRHRVRPAV